MSSMDMDILSRNSSLCFCTLIYFSSSIKKMARIFVTCPRYSWFNDLFIRNFRGLENPFLSFSTF